MRNERIAHWLWLVSIFICAMVILGGLVRLTYSGLSIVEWKVITGVVPPLSHEHWVAEFQKYQQTPQFQKVFPNMTLGQFQFIYYMEYVHRLLGRITGLLFAVPFFIFWARGVIRRNELPMFIAIGVLFAFQGFFGWYMVKSGLVDQPQVSHLRLTGHLLLALVLLAMTFSTSLSYLYEHGRPAGPQPAGAPRRLLLWLPWILLVQIGLGGMVAGLKAGLVSNTFPKMAGAWIPGLIASMQPWYRNLVDNPFTLHFLHRWFGVAIFILVVALYIRLRVQELPPLVRRALQVLVGLTSLQVVLGITAILLAVPLWLASLHQVTALAVFLTALFLSFQLRRAELPQAATIGTAELAGEG